MNNRSTEQPTGPSIASSTDYSPWLWLSAFVLAGLILVQGAGMLNGPAHAEMASASNGYAMMTTDGGSDEVLVVVDDFNESLMVYRVESGSRLVLQDREPLADLFARARQQSGLPPPAP